jgi:hypothetical protein
MHILLLAAVFVGTTSHDAQIAFVPSTGASALSPLSADAPTRFAPMPAVSGGGLQILCPETDKLFCGDSTDPSSTGYPTVTGACDRHPVITYSDSSAPMGCAADRFDHVITRTWTATDSCGNSASCDQKIDVLKQLIYLDMHPQSCPNPVNTNGNGNGVIPAALLGTANFDVTQIDPTSIQIWAEHCNGGPVSPVQYNYQDVATPYHATIACGCHTLGADGYMDLTLKFNRAQVVSALHLNNYPQFTQVRVFVVGKLTNGCEFTSTDCVRVQ